MREELKNNGGVPPWMELCEGWLLFRSGDLEGGELIARDYLGYYKEDAQVLNLLSQMAGVAGDNQAELKHAARAAELGPQDPYILANLGWVLADAGKKDEAIARLRAAIGIDPTLIYAYERLADLYRHFGDEDAALRELSQAMLLANRETINHPESSAAWIVVARLARKLGDYVAEHEANRQARRAAETESVGVDSEQIIATLDRAF